jgi:hypothetical protein
MSFAMLLILSLINPTICGAGIICGFLAKWRPWLLIALLPCALWFVAYGLIPIALPATTGALIAWTIVGWSLASVILFVREFFANRLRSLA